MYFRVAKHARASCYSALQMAMSTFSPECAEQLYGEISEAVCGFQARQLAGDFQLHLYTGEREQP